MCRAASETIETVESKKSDSLLVWNEDKPALQVIGVLFALKIVYPKQIFLVRGNHEDSGMNRLLARTGRALLVSNVWQLPFEGHKQLVETVLFKSRNGKCAPHAKVNMVFMMLAKKNWDPLERKPSTLSKKLLGHKSTSLSSVYEGSGGFLFNSQEELASQLQRVDCLCQKSERCCV